MPKHVHLTRQVKHSNKEEVN